VWVVLGVSLNADFRNNKQTSLFVACRNGHIDVTRALISAKADVNSKNGVEKTKAKTELCEETPLYTAAYSGRDAIVAALIESNAEVNLCRK
jgi:ankyrin repeat protein